MSGTEQVDADRTTARVRRRRRWVCGALVVMALLATGVSWVLASPVAGSPDDEYHLGSIWCPRPVASSGCQTAVIDGRVEVRVPETIAEGAPCFAFHPEKSAACRLSMSDRETTYSARYDDGNYPIGYYRFHHLLIRESVNESVLIMRMVNVVIAVALLGALGVLIPVRMRESYVLAMCVSWIPMGVYFIASNNPSSWALTGVFAYAAGLYASVRAQGRRRWVLLGLALVGALLSFTSRGDSSFFIFVASLAVLIGVRWRRDLLVQTLVAACASGIGVWIMSHTGQSRALEPAPPPFDMPAHARLMSNLRTLPEYFAGFYGRRWGAGWFDVPLDGLVTVIAIAVAGAAVFLGAGMLTWRKLLSALTVVGALAGVPLLVSMQQGFVRTFQYQPRYMLPLLAVFFLIWLDRPREGPVLSRSQVALLVGASVLVHSVAIHELLHRYTHGVRDPDDDLLFNLNFNPAWWWDLPVSPMTVWRAATVFYFIAIVVGVVLARTGPDRHGSLSSLRPAVLLTRMRRHAPADVDTGDGDDAGAPAPVVIDTANTASTDDDASTDNGGPQPTVRT